MKKLLLGFAFALSCTVGVYAQDTDQIREDVKEETEAVSTLEAINPLKFKPKKLKISYTNQVQYDDNVYKTIEFSDGGGANTRHDWKDVNTLNMSVKHKPDEDLHVGYSYLWYGTYHRNNSNKNIGLHKGSAFILYNLDPDPIKLRLDLGYAETWAAQNHFMTTRDVKPSIDVKIHPEHTLNASYSLTKTNFEEAFTQNGWSHKTQLRHTYKYGYSFMKNYFKTLTTTYAVKRDRPDDEASRYYDRGVKSKARFSLPYKIKLDAEYGRNIRHYDVSTSTAPTRKDNKDYFKFALKRKINKYFTAKADWKRSFRASNISSKRYHQNVFGIGLSASF